MDDTTARAVQAAIRDERTRLVGGLQRLKWKMLDRARATREAAPDKSAVYTECADLLTVHLLREVDPNGKDEPCAPS